ncbi:MAG TPA: glycosyltransferase family 39 protein [Blastocatellia bacterium]|nr:glycosyltransferase family 39 protein [Blastocatellia bacterium]
MSRRRMQVVGVILLTLIALGFRVHRLGAVGLSEDEARKVQAARAYLKGTFIVNTEHPMLMKSFIAGSLVASKWWNERIAHGRPGLLIPEEAAVRFPNALFGALTTIPLFLFACEMFTPLVGWTTAILWATGLNAIAINRIAKEDTLLVFFLWLGYFFFTKAKHEGPVETPRRMRLYMLSGASFGLMMASKYFPHYMGLIFLYNYLRPHDRQTNYPLGRQAMIRFFLALFLAFALANPIVFHPATVHSIGVYLTETRVPHHGYEMMGQLYYNNAWIFTQRTPFYFYFLFLLVKVPPVLILAFLVGLIIITRGSHLSARVQASALAAMAISPLMLLKPGSPDLKPVIVYILVLFSLSLLVGLLFVMGNRRDEGPFFLRFMLAFWIVPFTLFGGKWLRYTLSVMPLVYLTAAVGISVLIIRLRERLGPGWVRSSVTAGVMALFLLVPTVTALAHHPYYLLYVNTFGGGESRRAFYFPHDEIYDAGLREALQFIAERAPRHSIVAQDAPSVIAVYAEKFRRPDLVSVELSSREFDLARWTRHPDGHAREEAVYIIVQRGRRYFENEAWLQWLDRNCRPLTEIVVDGVTTTRVYELHQSCSVLTAGATTSPLDPREISVGIVPAPDSAAGESNGSRGQVLPVGSLFAPEVRRRARISPTGRSV